MVGLGKPQQHAKFEVASFSLAQILKGTPKFWAAPVAPGHVNFFFGVGFFDRPWQTPVVCQF